MTEREMLEALARLLNTCQFIEGDKESVTDMVQRYGNPPLTRAYPVAMKLSRAEYAQLKALMVKINNHLQPIEEPEPKEMAFDVNPNGNYDVRNA